ncbi:MAG: tyrosine-type recombinase/integrase [Clostridia bacterium]
MNIEIMQEYKIYLLENESSENTILKYTRDVKTFLEFLGNDEIDKTKVILFKEHLKSKYLASSVNSMLAAINNFLEFLGMTSLKIKPLKVQKEMFLSPEKELTKEEYERLVKTAESQNNTRLSLIIQTICSTGIRVSELKFVTVDSISTRRSLVNLKGKTRTIFLPKDLCKLLRKHCVSNSIVKGSVFVTKTGKPLDRSNIWTMMQKLCKKANVNGTKVFPHNLRHLFARTYYKIEKDISKLADILGHSSINTTRIYIMETGSEHIKQLNRMNLVRFIE